MYTNIHGVNPDTDRLLEILKLTKEQTGRFRDAFLNSAGDKITIFTRNGGGNREAYGEINKALAAHPCYIRDYDDEYDCTYALFEFSVPAVNSEECAVMAPDTEPLSLKEKSDAFMKVMDGMTPEQMRTDPRTKPMIDILDKIHNMSGVKIFTI
jgi:hypothetical protein